MTPNARVFCSGSMDGGLILWQLPDALDETCLYEKRCVLRAAHEGPVTSLSFGKIEIGNEGRIEKIELASGSADRSIRLWTVLYNNPDAKAYKLSHHIYRFGADTYKAFRNGLLWVLAVERASTQELLEQDSKGNLWKIQCMTVIHKAHDGKVQGVVFSPTTHTMVSVADDRVIKTWSCDTFQCLATIEDAHDGAITTIEYTKDGTKFITTGFDNRLRVWSSKLCNSIALKPLLCESYVLFIGSWSTHGTLVLTADGEVVTYKQQSAEQYSLQDITRSRAATSGSNPRAYQQLGEEEEEDDQEQEENNNDSSQEPAVPGGRRQLKVLGDPSKPQKLGDDRITAIAIGARIVFGTVTGKVYSCSNTAHIGGSSTSSTSSRPVTQELEEVGGHVDDDSKGVGVVLTATSWEISERRFGYVLGTRKGYLVSLSDGDHRPGSKTWSDCLTETKFDMKRNPSDKYYSVGILALAVSPDKKILAVGQQHGYISLFTLNGATFSERPFYRDRVHVLDVRSLAWGKIDDKLILFSGASSRSIKVHLFHQDKLEHLRTENPAHEGAVNVLKFTQIPSQPTPNVQQLSYLFSASDVNGIKIWRVQLDDEAIEQALVETADLAEKKDTGDEDKKPVLPASLTLLVHICVPCTVMSITDNILTASNLCRIFTWDWEELVDDRKKLQPTSSATLNSYSALVLPLPHSSDTFSPPTKAKVNKGNLTSASSALLPAPEDEETRAREAQATSQAQEPRYKALFKKIPFFKKKEADEEANKALTPSEEDLCSFVMLSSVGCTEYDSLIRSSIHASPWLGGLLVYMSAFYKNTNTLISAVNASVEKKFISYRPDKALFDHLKEGRGSAQWKALIGPLEQVPTPLEQFEPVCGLTLTVKNKNKESLKVLLDKSKELWGLGVSLATVFTAAHIIALVNAFPEMALEFFSPTSGLPQGSGMEEQDESSSNDRQYVRRKGAFVVSGSVGLIPFKYWTAKEKSGRTQEIPAKAWRLGVRDLAAEAPHVFHAIMEMKSEHIQEELFELDLFTYLVSYLWRVNSHYVIMEGFLTVLQLLLLLLVVFEDSRTHVGTIEKALTLPFLVLITASFAHREYLTYRAGMSFNLPAIINGSSCFVIFLVALLTVLDLHILVETFCLEAVAVLLGWFKLLFYLRVWRKTSFLVSALAQIIKDMAAITIVISFAVLGFANAIFLILHQETDAKPKEFMMYDKEEESKNHFSSWGSTILSLFWALLGSFEPDQVTSAAKHAPIATAVFAVYLVIIMLIMMNVMIAIVSDSFNRVQSRADVESKRELVHSLLRLMIRPPVHLLYRDWIQVLRQSTIESASDGNFWEGQVKLLSRRIEASEKRLETKFSDQVSVLSSKIKTIREGITTVDKSVKTEALETPKAEIEKKYPTPTPSRFNIAPLRTSISVTLDETAGIRRYTLNLNDRNIYYLYKLMENRGVTGGSEYSPGCAVTLPVEIRRDVLIPEIADSFVFAYHLPGVECLSRDDEVQYSLLDSRFNFLLYGETRV
eukprot:c20343_g2_i2.p1 GENE.c20343_g2_i2~~c20343_g2_i2.p1  ORF type:complete len:1512 (+),score=369.75 c20343_g2_i2:476-5011(+)